MRGAENFPKDQLSYPLSPFLAAPLTTQAAPWLSIVHPTPQYGICTRSSQSLCARGLGCPTLQEFDRIF